MRHAHRQFACIAQAVVLAAMLHLPVVAGADSLLSEIFSVDTGTAWSPGPVNAPVQSAPAGEDEVDSEFLWAGDRKLGLLMSFDPDDEEVFLGWHVGF